MKRLRDQLLALRIPEPADPRGYCADPSVEWPIVVELRAPVARGRISEAFEGSWRGKNGIMVHGLPAGESRWTFPDAKDAPENYESLELAVRLVDSVDEEGSLEAIVADVRRRAEPLGATSVKPRYPLDQAEARAEELASLRDWIEDEADDGKVSISIAADEDDGFDSDAVIELFASLGFTDFESQLVWANGRGCKGGDAILTVAHDDDTIDMSIDVPRTAEPLAALDAAIAIAELVVEKLGGEISDADDAREGVTAIVERLAEAGLRPGDSATCILL